MTKEDCFQMLLDATLENCRPASYDGLVTHGKLLRNYDGDTGDLALLDSNGRLVRVRVRFIGYDSPEVHPPLNHPDRENVVRRAELAKRRLWQICTVEAGPILRVHCGEFDKYGRLLVTVYSGYVAGKTTSINEQMILEGHGVPYGGGSRQAFGSQTEFYN